MHALPAVSVLSVLAAAVAAFVVGGIYFAVVANRLTRLIGGTPDEGRWPAPALVAAFLTRGVAAFAIAVLVGYTGASGPIAGAVIGALAFCGFMLPLLIGQAAFGGRWGSWTNVAVGGLETLLGFAVMGAVVGTWQGH